MICYHIFCVKKKIHGIHLFLTVLERKREGGRKEMGQKKKEKGRRKRKRREKCRKDKPKIKTDKSVNLQSAGRNDGVKVLGKGGKVKYML